MVYSDHLLKILLVGDVCVGKTSLLLSFVNENQSAAIRSTIVMDFVSRRRLHFSIVFIYTVIKNFFEQKLKALNVNRKRMMLQIVSNFRSVTILQDCE